MKKIIVFALFASLFFSCTKDSQIVSPDPVVSETAPAQDRELEAYQFGINNSTLYPYCFQISVSPLGSPKTIVWTQGGCFSQNTYYTVYLTPGQQYNVNLTFTPNNPGQTGTIHWQLRKFNPWIMCSEGNMSIPSGQLQSILWTACQ